MTLIKTPKKSIRKKLNVKKRESSDSSGINFSDSDLDLNTSLRTRIQKKLVKNNLKSFSPTPKKILSVNENENKVIKKSVTKIDNKTISSKTKQSENKKQIIEKVDIDKTKVFSFLYSLSGKFNKFIIFLYRVSYRVIKYYIIILDCLPSWQSDKEARFFRDNYAKEKESLSKRLFNFYNDEVFKKAIPSDTLIEWNPRINKTAGLCYNRRITRRDGRIERACRIVLAPKVKLTNSLK